MEEIKSFLESKLLKDTFKVKKVSSVFFTKTRLNQEDFDKSCYCQFKEVPSNKILDLMELFFDLDIHSKVESLFSSFQCWEINSSNQQQVMEEIKQEFQSKNVSEFNVEKMIHCLDELISNSLFASAPEFKSQTGERHTKQLKPVEVKIVSNADFHAIVVRDNYGLFDKNTQRKVFGKELGAKVMINSRPGMGAGVGLQIVRELSSLLIYRQKSRHWTECVVFFVKNNKTQAPLVFYQI